jgi:hypothetical protein
MSIHENLGSGLSIPIGSQQYSQSKSVGLSMYVSKFLSLLAANKNESSYPKEMIAYLSNNISLLKPGMSSSVIVKWNFLFGFKISREKSSA